MKILIIDGSQFVREQLSKYFQHRKQTVFAAGTGQEAINIAKTVSPDVVLIDINLPKVSGALVVQELRSLDPDVRIIGISSTTDKDNVMLAIKSGISLFKLKPFRIDTLVNEVLTK